jgi:mannosyltransferase
VPAGALARFDLTRRGTPAALALIVGAGALIRFSTLAQQSYWFDEVVTVDIVRKPFTSMFGDISRIESTPPLYYIFAWLWTRLVGDGEFALRSLSAVFGTLAIPVAYAAGTTLSSRRAGLVAAALCAASPLLVWYSQEARSYALFAFLSALSLLAFARALREPSSPRLALWACVASLALTTHYFALFIVMPEGLWLLVSARKMQALLANCAVAATGAALLPLALEQRRRGHGGGTERAVSLKARVGETARQFLTGQYPIRHALVIVLSLALVVLAIALLAVTARKERPGALTALSVGAAALLLPLVLAVIGEDYLLYRNLIGAWILLAVGAGILLAARGAPTLTALAALLVSLQLAATITIANRPSLQRENWRAAVTRLGIRPHARAIVVEPYYLRRALDLYGLRLDYLIGRARVREVDYVGEHLPSQFVHLPRAGHPIVSTRSGNLTVIRLRLPAAQSVRPAQLVDASHRDPPGVFVEPNR